MNISDTSQKSWTPNNNLRHNVYYNIDEMKLSNVVNFTFENWIEKQTDLHIDSKINDGYRLSYVRN